MPVILAAHAIREARHGAALALRCSLKPGQAIPWRTAGLIFMFHGVLGSRRFGSGAVGSAGGRNGLRGGNAETMSGEEANGLVRAMRQAVDAAGANRRAQRRC
jgi:hypothetical protein